MRLHTKALFFLILLTSFTAPAQPPKIVIASATRSSVESGSELTIVFEDSVPAPNACPYFVKRMEYVAAINSLLVQLGTENPCLIDLYGKRKSQLKWDLPASALREAPLKIILNDFEAGTLRFTGAGVEVGGQ